MNCPRTCTRVFGAKSSALTFVCRDIQSKILQRIYNRATAEEQKWIVCIVLKGTSLSFNDVR